MTADEVIAMAQRAGYPHVGLNWNDQEQAFLMRFAALVAKAEREACAQIAADGYYGNAGELNHVLAAAGAVPLTCEWTHNDDDGFWETACGEAWRFDDGGPGENSMHFCHSCGKSLRIKGGQHGADT